VKAHMLGNKLSVAARRRRPDAALCRAGPRRHGNTLHNFPIEQALAKAQASGKLVPGVKLFFGKQPYPKATTQLGQARTNKKTNFLQHERPGSLRLGRSCPP